MGLEIDPIKDLKDQINSKDGVRVSYSIDIRVVERFFKRLFGKKDNPPEDKKDDGQNQ